MPSIKVVNDIAQIPVSNEWKPSTKFNSKNRIVTLEGNSIESIRNGVKYVNLTEAWHQIIDKKERAFSDLERILRCLLGILAFIGSAGLALLSKSVVHLFTKSNEAIRYAINIPKDPSKIGTLALSVLGGGVEPKQPDFCKTAIDELEFNKINPFKIDYKENGMLKTAKVQAQEILQYMTDIFNTPPDQKIAITYSANTEQAENIYQGYITGEFSIGGSNQAEVFSIIVSEIKQNGWQNKVHILPIPTCEKAGGATVAKQEDVMKAMDNIAWHLGNGWVVLGLQNQDCKAGFPFAIGGGVANGVWAHSAQRAYVDKCMMDMHNGLVKENEDLKNAFQKGVEDQLYGRGDI